MSLPDGDDGPPKVEGLAVRSNAAGELDVIAVVDADDAGAPSQALELRVVLPR